MPETGYSGAITASASAPIQRRQVWEIAAFLLTEGRLRKPPPLRDCISDEDVDCRLQSDEFHCHFSDAITVSASAPIAASKASASG